MNGQTAIDSQSMTAGDPGWQEWHARLPETHKAFVARCMAAGLAGSPEKFEAIFSYLPSCAGGGT